MSNKNEFSIREMRVYTHVVYSRHIYRMQWKSIIMFNICSVFLLSLSLSFSASFQCYRCKVLGACVVGNCIPFSKHTLIENFCHSHMRAMCTQSNLLYVLSLSLSLSPLLSLIWFESWLLLFLSLLFGAALCFATGYRRVRVFVAEKAVSTVFF